MGVPDRGRWRWVAGIAVLTILYVLVAKLGLDLNAVSGFATLVWVPIGISLTALLLFGMRLWPGVTLGAIIANLWVGAPLTAALGIAAGNTLEAVVATIILHRLSFQNAMGRLRDVVGFTVTVSAATVISATMGVTSLLATGAVASTAYTETWIAWWLGDTIGALVFAPPLLVWFSPPQPTFNARKILETMGVIALLVVSVTVVFLGDSVGPLQQPYILFAPVIAASLRFGQRGTVSIIPSMSVLAITATAMGRGPFVRDNLTDSLIFLQVFVATVAITGLFLGAAVTERQARTADLIRVNHELSELAKARELFMSFASHELRTPLGALRLQVSILMSHADLGHERLSEKLRLIERQVERLNRLIDNLLETSRINAGRIDIEPEPVELTGLVRDVASRFKDEMQRAGCRLDIFAGDVIMGVWDPLRIDQVVSNLLANAIKYGAGQPIEIHVWASGDVVHLQVRDHGIGIAPEDQPRIFDRFERAVAHRHATGFGLGLWICKQIVDAMGGHIHLTSAPGSGSTFSVEFPRHHTPPMAEDDEAVQTKSASAAAGKKTGAVKILRAWHRPPGRALGAATPCRGNGNPPGAPGFP